MRMWSVRVRSQAYSDIAHQFLSTSIYVAKRLGLAPPLLPHHAAASELLQPTLAPLEEQSAEGSESDSQLDRSSMSTKPGTPPAVSFQSPLLR